MEIFNFPLLIFDQYLLTLTPDSVINVGPTFITFINFGFFSRAYDLINGPKFTDFWNILLALWLFSSLIVVALCLFKALRLLF